MSAQDIHKHYINADKALRNYAKSGEEKRSNWLYQLAEIRQEEENKLRKVKYEKSQSTKKPKVILTSTELKKLKMEEESRNSH